VDPVIGTGIVLLSVPTGLSRAPSNTLTPTRSKHFCLSTPQEITTLLHGSNASAQNTTGPPVNLRNQYFKEPVLYQNLYSLNRYSSVEALSLIRYRCTKSYTLSVFIDYEGESLVCTLSVPRRCRMPRGCWIGINATLINTTRLGVRVQGGIKSCHAQK
jgi:hypothetical protein